MVHSNGIREPATTLLSTDLAVTSWKVIPAKSGVETDRTSPASGSRAGAAGESAERAAGESPRSSACASHLMPTFEYMFD